VPGCQGGISFYALLAKHKVGVDVRITIRGEFVPIGSLELLQKRGFDMGNVRLQNRFHIKGIIVDRAWVLIGSHDWTNQGTRVNRDAGLIFEDEKIAEFFEEMLLVRWKAPDPAERRRSANSPGDRQRRGPCRDAASVVERDRKRRPSSRNHINSCGRDG
jgi:phosphatidylserine/phosphatidylglycerophosphate/cardiolipin synthase-like enzyme